MSVVACGGEQRTNVFGQPELTQEELDEATAEAKSGSSPSAGTQHDQTELTVAEDAPPPPKKPPRPRKMDAPTPLTRGKKLTPVPSASQKPTPVPSASPK